MTAALGVPRSVFAALARGGGGARAIGLLRAARLSRTKMLVRAIADLAEKTRHPAAAATRAAFAALARPPLAEVHAVLDHPRVGVWALRTYSLLRKGVVTAAAPGMLAAVAAAAQVRARVPGVIDLEPAGEVVLPSLGTFRADGPARVITSAEGSVVSDGRGRTVISPRPAKHWRPVGELCAEHGGLRLRLSVDGIAFHDLPDEVTVQGRFADEREAAVWRARITEGWRTLVEDHRGVAEEVAAALTVLTPLSAPRVGLISVTFANSFGCVAMSLPDNAREVALTFAHEVQHAKLAVLADLFPLVDQESAELLYAPWRPDPRPPDALLQGAYAHLGVAGFWRRYRDFEAQVEFARWRAAVLEALDALTGLTPSGQAFVAHMRDVLETWCAEPVSASARAEAARRNAEHRQDSAGGGPRAGTR
ncbi:aKG-HExxH-type peptide beta-hydroxylase [Lentzea flava]|uniref:HEXXH motif domain-containing protein n=1 Tax=Lentzea flava TaxID=103732 RepID=A0ABQ2V3K6_9PSEU|nr:HEXXH motif-containing putative peptide modification protein [Lentzea flava]MCP2203328.1 HEXXH motif-containing protein [Lentzea flava]GGU66944.1 HEXXH motif domain-containing protein [Lentzea flava]